MSPEEAAFEYELPRDLIAQEPLHRRVDARLMLVNRSTRQIDHFHVRDLPELLRVGDRLVLNDTRVVPARLVGRRSLTGGRWQGLFLGLAEDGKWHLLQKTRGSIQPGELIHVEDRDGKTSLVIRLVERGRAGQWTAEPVLEAEDDQDAFTLLDRVGRVPLPPYIRGGNMVDADIERYQTVFARHRGAVAAPTAGLHFTEKLLRQISKRGCEFSAVTLHVGLDTFRPISTNSIEEHMMHSESIELTFKAAAEINATRTEGGRVVAVGTTSVRVLETAARGVSGDTLPIAGSRNAYSTCVTPFFGETDLFIRPPYSFRAVDVMLTNFHFPQTTLLVLVSTFAGRELMRQAYEEAIAERYRFFSYGDAMLIV